MSTLLAALAARKQFIVYKLVPLPNGKIDKVPVNPADGKNSNAQKSTTWMLPHLAQACALALGPGHGVGIVIHAGCGLFCIDIDGGIDAAGNLSPLAAKLVGEYPGCYIERSQSGTGLHIIASYSGAPPVHSTKNIELHIELYTKLRFIALTVVGEGDPLTDATQQLWATAWGYFRKPVIDGASNEEWHTEDDPACTITGTDDERIAYGLRMKSMAAKFGGGRATFADLWNCNVETLARTWPGEEGKPYNASHADQSIANSLCFLFANNCDTVLRIMREHAGCALRREKWQRDDYLIATILKAAAIPKRWRITRQPILAPDNTQPPSALRAPIQAPQQQSAPHQHALSSDAPIAHPEGVPAPPDAIAPPPPSNLPAAVPAALFSCTDQANAERLQRLYGTSLISVAGDFYSWDGRRWKLDDGSAQRYACDLSRIVSLERQDIARQLKAMETRADEGLGDALLKAEVELKALAGWAAKCENVATQNNALSLLRKLLNVPVERIDANPWLLNVLNGTVDLRTGVLLPHDSSQLITKLAPTGYDPAAPAPRFTRFLSEIFQHDGSVVAFIQRWYGYASTGDAREQKILIKHGPGGNGKSTLGEAIDSVLGEYSSPATMGLLTGKDNAGSTAQLAEIADLRGKRLVSASESEDGAKLKEAQLKQLTGGDSLKGKRLYGQLFSFRPTHKLELLTNHKPVIKGSDFSIWRRIMLLSFPVKFGSAAEVEAGEAMALRDPTLGEALRTEATGILAWIVAGARLWLSEGLAPPKAVTDASAEYREQQDHIAEFLADCCTLERTAKQPLPPLYQAYKGWCHSAGRDYPATRQRLVDELERRVPGFIRPDRTRRTAQGTYVTGLTLAAIT